jgi:DNA-binding transcriptional MerR regulator
LVHENSTFGIGDLAREFGITPRAIRFYEDQGMISPQRIGNGGRIRVYSQRDRARLKLLLRGKRLGLSLQEIRGLLDMYETPADTVPQLNRFLSLLDERRQSLQLQLTDLHQMLADIERQRSDAERMLAGLQNRSAAGLDLPRQNAA